MSFYGSGILKGLAIVFKNLLRGPITVQYPKQKVELPERARWAVEMKLDEDGEHKCTGCLACERACPDYVIKIDVTTDEERNKHIDRWRYDIGACMMCALCVEACPFDAIRMGHDYELARTDRDQLTIHLLKDAPAAKPKRKQAAERPKPAPKSGEAEKGTPEAAPDPTAVDPVLGNPEQQGGQPVDETARSTPAAKASEEAPVDSEKLEVEPAPTHEERSEDE